MKHSFWKKTSRVALATVLAASVGLLAACGGGADASPSASASAEATSEAASEAASEEATSEAVSEAASEAPSEAAEAVTTFDNVTVKIGATAAPHAEILENIKPDLAARGINLEITIFDDYIQPNVAVSDGQLDANFFQHIPYLNDYNEKNGTKLVSAASIHFEPMAIFPGKTTSIEELADGAKIALPNDTTNEARALQLLADNGILTLKEGVGLEATKLDIVENPKNIEFFEVAAEQVPRSLQDVDLAVINGNYAIAAGLQIADALATESTDSAGAKEFPNVIVVNEGNEERPEILALIEAVTSDSDRTFIEEKYQGAVVPLF